MQCVRDDGDRPANERGLEECTVRVGDGGGGLMIDFSTLLFLPLSLQEVGKRRP